MILDGQTACVGRKVKNVNIVDRVIQRILSPTQLVDPTSHLPTTKIEGQVAHPTNMEAKVKCLRILFFL